MLMATQVSENSLACPQCLRLRAWKLSPSALIEAIDRQPLSPFRSQGLVAKLLMSGLQLLNDALQGGESRSRKGNALSPQMNEGEVLGAR